MKILIAVIVTIAIVYRLGTIGQLDTEDFAKQHSGVTDVRQSTNWLTGIITVEFKSSTGRDCAVDYEPVGWPVKHWRVASITEAMRAAFC
jgi:hypothetical protein